MLRSWALRIFFFLSSSQWEVKDERISLAMVSFRAQRQLQGYGNQEKRRSECSQSQGVGVLKNYWTTRESKHRHECSSPTESSLF